MEEEEWSEGSVMPTPLLILSDDPSQNSGLARITRDLATILTGQPEWRIATLGWMGTGSSKLPWMGYHMFPNETGELSLPQVWDEFSQGEWGVVMTVWDLSRLGWLSRPDLFDSPAREWLAGARGHRFKLWGYIPIDSTGPGNRLTTIYREVLLGMDRIVTYSPWAEDVVRNTLGADEGAKRGLGWLPHGLGATWTLNAPMDHSIGNDYDGGSARTHGNDISTMVEGLGPQSGKGFHGEVITTAEVQQVPEYPSQQQQVGAAGLSMPEARQPQVEEVQASVGALKFKHQYYGWRGDKLGTWPVEEGDGPTLADIDRVTHEYLGMGSADASLGKGSEGGAEEEAGLVGASDNCDDPRGSAAGAGSKEEAVPVVRVGVVATNQARKDWGLVAAIARGLREVRPDVQWWWHLDCEIRAWSIPALLADFGIADIVEVTSGVVTDEQLAAGYRTCALTIAPGGGEGFGYPIFESLACGVPVLHGDYAGGASIMRTCKLDNWLIQPITYRIEGQYNAVRPVYDPAVWVEAISEKLTMALPLLRIEQQVEHLAWNRLKYPWRRWMREGL